MRLKVTKVLFKKSQQCGEKNRFYMAATHTFCLIRSKNSSNWNKYEKKIIEKPRN